MNAVLLTDLQSVTGTVSGAVDAEGHPTDISGATFSAESDNTAICSASFADNVLTIAADGTDLGLAHVNILATLADGSTVPGTVDVTVSASAPTGLSVTFDAPTP